jgi:hypothetical protein
VVERRLRWRRRGHAEAPVSGGWRGLVAPLWWALACRPQEILRVRSRRGELWEMDGEAADAGAVGG